MALATLINVSSTSNLTLPENAWTSLIGGAASVLGTGGGVSIQGYMYNVDFSQVEMRIVVDGVDLVESATPQIMINKVLSIGTHSIDLQALALNQDATATTRGLLALSL